MLAGELHSLQCFLAGVETNVQLPYQLVPDLDMRPHHLILVCLGVIGLPTILTFLSLLRRHPRGQIATESTSDDAKGGVRALFSFHTPSTLFPPSAIISLTDDNSTFFLARPADFGPSLRANGLSGQLWIGSGFGDDTTGRGAAGIGAEGELGCSDVPGWEDGGQLVRKDTSTDPNGKQDGSEAKAIPGQPGKTPTVKEEDEDPAEGDGTDDHLHHPLPSSPGFRPPKSGESNQHPPADPGHPSTHADIQSLQEGAEISGKVVLLSRGGCGFLEKVKWAQRRGAAALIVGDHTRGGALITMYARGDTSNVTIPSLFTSHTTAHLLSSLIPPEIPSDELEPGEGSATKPDKEGSKDRKNDDRPTFTPISTPRSTSVPSSMSKRSKENVATLKAWQKKGVKSSWLGSLFGLNDKSGSTERAEDSRRPPSSGRLDWFSEKLTDESPKGKAVKSNKNEKPKSKDKAKTQSGSTSKEASKAGLHSSAGDDFVIGVQDWRDPDLVAAKPSSHTKSTTTTRSSAPTPLASKALYKGSEAGENNLETAFQGGSITPGSGRYQKFGSKDESQDIGKSAAKEDRVQPAKSTTSLEPALSATETQGSDEEHEGLWVTLTPTTMSTSPFFDTLLVLVVSPLITLTVVYALLLLRSRIRRRRWRAPKSVVDRLPIRTYHTMSCTSTTSSSRAATPHSSSPTSPLLYSSPRSVTARTRPRSATASGIEATASASVDHSTSGTMSQQEKRTVPNKPKKSYRGKQVECVVCLEEYIDGESRVMSLPCGHEFHAECM